MVKITLYNIGGYKKKQVFYCFVGFFCIHSICIPDIIKISRRHVFGRKNISASMLRIYKNKNRITLRALDRNLIISVSFYDVRFPIEYQHSIWSNVLWRCRVYSVFKKINIVASKNIYIMYIYINSTLVSTIHTHFKKMLKNIFIKKYMWRTKPYRDVCVTRYIY